MIDKQKLKVCLVDNMAPYYRKKIFSLIDSEYDCKCYFGYPYDGIKDLSLDFFKDAEYTPIITCIRSPLFWQVGLLKLLTRKDIDVILIGGGIINVSFWFMLIVHRLFHFGPKIYNWSHGMLRIRRWPRSTFEKIFYKMHDGIFVYGDRAIKIMKSQGIDGKKLFPIHNSLDYDEQIRLRDVFTDIYKRHFENNYSVLFFVGRLTPVKKLDMVFKALYLLKEKGCNLNFVLIGDGTQKNNLQVLSKKLGLMDRVWFYGACYNEEEKSELITNADLCVSPGNIGLTAIDSLMYGTPVVTMDNQDMQMPEHEAIKTGITGFFFKENDVQDLAKKIYMWFLNGYDRNLIRQNCYKEVDDFWNPYYQIKVIKENLKK